MQFNSYEFILYFLPITVLLYFLANKIKPVIGKLVIVVSSIVFYSMGKISMLIYLGISILINYTSALVIKKFKIKNKALLALPIIVNVVLLFYFKYYNFTIANINIFFGKEFALKNIILPLGISFYTFQQIAYVVATENENLENNDIIDYLAYILYFPKLIMGPIIDPVDYISQLNQNERKKANLTNITTGIKIFSLGLIKKVLLADTFAKAVSWAYTNIDAITSMDCILLIVFYTFEIYFDFSGYSDMAVGVSSMLNIDLPMNFDSPYKAISIRDFWKRWHISLTKFLTKYIYIPLGGSRKGMLFTYVNTIIVFLVSGLWHGANWTFILWGGLHGLFSCFDRMFEKAEEKVFMPVRWVCTFGVVSVLWLLFSTQTVEQWKSILFKILLMQNTAVSDGMVESFNLAENQFIYNVLGLNFLPTNVRGFNMLIFILVASFVCFVPENNYKKRNSLNVGSLLLSAIAFIWGVLCLGAESTFVYFGF
ncbi:MBOAT family O-acyltransferase [Pseudobutyrivibrio ruminis]|uniref:D-alanyl-lipoteichoic acid acyltransferase DltB, MBOAT superfamily n=1 Tax=Pseudobutyrivibrio ruminis DSM 9787 TaxID=1123011 RepID=A0A285S8L2_9FIRM|nr:MBOAT family O-acyltransferase [Pseudobutyrivibrio ruminis]SOC03930.1 D-alanyl-lipoteichoic acid acyltransferase DltB, MBOAT superfamily [Pseudobutyrivibrio ruminis DSM 9787]